MAMQITQKSGEGLSRVYGVTVPIQDLLEKFEARVNEIRPQMNIKGFRPGKVPAAHVKRMYGKSLMSEIVQQALNDTQQQALDEAKVRVATSPDLQLDGDIEKVLAGQADLTYDLSVQVMPEFEPVDITSIELQRPVHPVADEEVDEQLKTIAEQNRTYEKKAGGKKAKAEEGDMVVADFVGRIDGEAFEGGSAEAAEIVIGSNRFIPGFEEQLIGAKQDATVTVNVTFPEEYGAAHLAGKPAEFEVTVKEIRAPKEETAVDEDFAKRLGFDTLEALKEAIRNQVGQQYQAASRFKAKRALLDVLDEKHDFELPPGMVESEFGAIWAQVEQERAAGELSEEDKDKTEEQLRAEYRKIAERRVRLGLVLAEIGQRNNVQVSEQEMQQALFNEVRRYPREQQQQAFEFFRSNPQAAAQLRAPIYEEKVVDLILEKAKVEDTPVSKDELFKEDELPAGYGE
jgi:trigger factor